MMLETPSEEDLDRLYRQLGWRFPGPYVQFVQDPDAKFLEKLNNMLGEGWFVRHESDIREFVAAEMTGVELPMFFVKGSRDQMKDIDGYGSPPGLMFIGFDIRSDVYLELNETPVVVFSLHAIVAGWNSFFDFVDYVMSQSAWKDNTGWEVNRYGFLVRSNAS